MPDDPLQDGLEADRLIARAIESVLDAVPEIPGSDLIAAEADAVADGHAAGNPHHAAHNTAFADADIVTDVHMVIDFCATPNPRGFERGAIDGGAGADLHVVADHDTA